MIFQPIDTKTNTFLANCYLVQNIEDEDTFINTWIQKNLENSTFKYLYTLDDFGQASYTSMHTIESYNLDNSDGYNLNGLEDAVLDDKTHKLFLKTVYEDGDSGEKLFLNNLDEFFIRKENFLQHTVDITLQNIIEKQPIFNADEFFSENSDITAILDNEVYLLEVPVEKYYETIIAFPNGYFTDDLTPFENYFLAKILEEEFGYLLFGIGASSIAFYKKDKVDSSKLAKIFCKIYRCKDDKEYTIFKTIIENKKLLVLKYLGV